VNLKAAKSKKEKEKEKDMYAKQNSILSAKRSYFPFSANNGREIKKRKPSKIPPPPFESARLVSCCLNSPDTDTKAEKKKRK
jgi:hypothetical protein